MYTLLMHKNTLGKNAHKHTHMRSCKLTQVHLDSDSKNAHKHTHMRSCKHTHRLIWTQTASLAQAHVHPHMQGANKVS